MYHRGVKGEVGRHGFLKRALFSMEQLPLESGLSCLPVILLSLGRDEAPSVQARGVSVLQLGVVVLRMDGVGTLVPAGEWLGTWGAASVGWAFTSWYR